MSYIERKTHSKYHHEAIVHHDNSEIKEITRMDQLKRGTGYGKGSARRDNLNVYQRNYDDIFGKKNKKKKHE